jgi:threonine dehydrogenase-like Zn-dependent dehydrogenase
VRAVRLAGPRRLELIESPDPHAGEGEAVLRVSACGICGSDLSCYKTGVYTGSVLGHEFAGVVETVGPGVSGFVPGRPVLVDPKVPCGRCADCRSGAEYRCAIGLTTGPGGMRDGALAEFVSVPVACLHPMPSGLRVEDACLVEPLAVAIHGVERAGGVTPGEDAVVVGLGPIGLLTVAALRAKGAGTVTGIDPVEVRRDLAEKLGADRVAQATTQAPSGVPLVFECTGRADILQETTNLAGAGGRVSLLGVPIAEASVMTLPWVAREISVFGSIASSTTDFIEAAELLAREPGIAAIITRRISLDEVPEAFETLVTSPADGKVVAEPNR